MAGARYQRRANYGDQPGEKRGHLARTYRMRRETVQALDTLCELRGWYPSRIVDLLVADGLQQIQCGEIEIAERPVMFDIDITR